MPCHDITDRLKIHLDENDRITRYELRKRTCGGEVGHEALIGRWLRGQNPEQLLSTPARRVLEAHPTPSDIGEYLVLKHFLAVQTALAALTGRQSAGAGDYCTIESVEYGPEGTTLSANIDVKAMTGEIKACWACCGKINGQNCKKNEPNSSNL